MASGLVPTHKQIAYYLTTLPIIIIIVLCSQKINAIVELLLIYTFCQSVPDRFQRSVAKYFSYNNICVAISMATVMKEKLLSVNL